MIVNDFINDCVLHIYFNIIRCVKFFQGNFFYMEWPFAIIVYYCRVWTLLFISLVASRNFTSNINWVLLETWNPAILIKSSSSTTRIWRGLWYFLQGYLFIIRIKIKYPSIEIILAWNNQIWCLCIHCSF